MSLYSKILISLFFAIFALQGSTLFAQSEEFNPSSTSATERIRSYRYQSDEMNQKITSLPTNAEYAIKIPVLFGVGIKNIAPNFGDPRSGGRTHLGEDIMAIDGTPIVSPTKAVVLRTGTGPSEGLYVYTANPGGETFVYMHLSKIGEGVVEGTVLEQGSLIGYVGNTGNAIGGAAHLHFEVHTADRVAVDPFPKLTQEFTIAEKMVYLYKILAQTSDANTLSLFLVKDFRSTFNLALTQGVVLPSIIQNLLSTTPSINVPLPTVPTVGDLPADELAYGSKGPLVITLQQKLIARAVGPAGIRLAQAGATGSFGLLTENALKEYQMIMNISPANGYYGSATKTLLESSTMVTTLTPTQVPVLVSNNNLNRNLYKKQIIKLYILYNFYYIFLKYKS